MIYLNYPKCSTCQKAKKFLDKNKIEYENRNIKENNPTYEELKEWYEKSNLPIKKFFNTFGNVYKELGLKDKLESMTDDEKLKLLSTNGMLIKRPIIISDKILIGFKESEWSILKNN
ncbi:MAG: arsenate reductase family protein [Defluviitaleaceae bacterium]|nr:arsenate reductase family protein [Defluviitaleaceae bacterium]